MGFSGNNGDVTEQIFSVLQEMHKRSNFVNKNDAFAFLKSRMDRNTFDLAMERLMEDGRVYTAYNDDTITINV